jgi:hypothetical protein
MADLFCSDLIAVGFGLESTVLFSFEVLVTLDFGLEVAFLSVVVF